MLPYRLSDRPGAGHPRWKGHQLALAHGHRLAPVGRYRHFPLQEIAGLRLVIGPGKFRHFLGPNGPAFDPQLCQRCLAGVRIHLNCHGLTSLLTALTANRFDCIESALPWKQSALAFPIQTAVFCSIVIPTYNRRPILEKCLIALETQVLPTEMLIEDYEVIVVDDGSTDDTIPWIQSSGDRLPHVKLFERNHQGPAAARNFGVGVAQGDLIIFIDSDLVVTESFLAEHSQALQGGYDELGSDRCFTYGRVVNTANFENPWSEPYKITDMSRAYFATGNVAIARHWLEDAGLFDLQFQLYGWEDLELGVRLKKFDLKLIPAPKAVGYHWHPAFSLEQIPKLIQQEIERGKMGVVFYKKHPTFDVKLMIQMTWLHRVLWGVLSLGGWLNERTLAPLLQWLIDRDRPQLALEIARIFLNWYNVKAVHAAYRNAQLNTPNA